MATKIRLARGGAKKRPYYRIVVTNSRSPRDGDFIERIGSYNPMLPKDSKDRLVIDEDRAKHWLSVGAKPTDRVQYFLHMKGLVKEAPAQKAARKPKKDKGGDASPAAAPADAAA